MFQATTISSKWQMTIPKKIRESLGLKTPGKFMLEIADRKEKLIRIKERADILELAGFLKPKKGKSILKAREEMEKNYKRI